MKTKINPMKEKIENVNKKLREKCLASNGNGVFPLDELVVYYIRRKAL